MPSKSNKLVNDTNTEAKLQLHEEQLEISKTLVHTGEVNMYKDIFTEERNITVPVIHEDLVVEKKTMNGETETIRIPISEERIEVTKHPVVLEDVEIFKESFQENKHIEETLKKEEVKIETSGSPKVIYNENKNVGY